MAETPALIIALTQAQQLQVLAATGLTVTTLEVPLETLADGDEETVMNDRFDFDGLVNGLAESKERCHEMPQFCG